MFSSLHACLEPSSGGTLAIIDEDFYEKYFSRGKCILEVSYFNRYGEWHSFRVAFHGYIPIIVQDEKKQPGFFLSIADFILMLRTYLAP